MQVDPIKPTSKAPRNNRLKLNPDELLLKFAFKFKMRRFIKGSARGTFNENTIFACGQSGIAVVGRCRLPVSEPVLKAPMVSALDTLT